VAKSGPHSLTEGIEAAPIAQQLRCSLPPNDHLNFSHSTTCHQTSNLTPKPSPLNMATSNDTESLKAHLEERYVAAMAIGRGRDVCIRELEELLLEDQLQLEYRLTANMALATIVPCWFHREAHRLAAVQVHSELSARVATQEGHEIEIVKRNYRAIGVLLDVVCEDQRREDPRPRAADKPTIMLTINEQAAGRLSAQATLVSGVQDVSQEDTIQHQSSSDDETQL
jgi:hypothetical protein